MSVEWCSSYMVQGLVGTEDSHSDLKQATKRQEAMASICYRRSNGELAGYTPKRVQEVISLITGWPTVPFGGCRYLQETSIKLIGQCTVLWMSLGRKRRKMFGEKLSDNEIRDQN